jgi:hypothetical protein
MRGLGMRRPRFFGGGLARRISIFLLVASELERVLLADQCFRHASQSGFVSQSPAGGHMVRDWPLMYLSAKGLSHMAKIES